MGYHRKVPTAMTRGRARLLQDPQGVHELGQVHGSGALQQDPTQDLITRFMMVG